MIAVLDGRSLQAKGVAKALTHLGAAPALVTGAAELERANRLIIPNASGFKEMIAELRDRGFVSPLLDCFDRGVPVLGIGAGMHALLDVCYDGGQHSGLGLLHGKATPFTFGAHPAERHFPPRHEGWNQVKWCIEWPLMAGLGSGAYFYFDHALHAEPLDARQAKATANHGVEFCAVIGNGLLTGVQFLPERSEEAGQKVLSNFLAM